MERSIKAMHFRFFRFFYFVVIFFLRGKEKVRWCDDWQWTLAAKALSTLASTAAFDKHPQSKQRGITLDLGFSAFLAVPSSRIRGRQTLSSRQPWAHYNWSDMAFEWFETDHLIVLLRCCIQRPDMSRSSTRSWIARAMLRSLRQSSEEHRSWIAPFLLLIQSRAYKLRQLRQPRPSYF